MSHNSEYGRPPSPFFPVEGWEMDEFPAVGLGVGDNPSGADELLLEVDLMDLFREAEGMDCQPYELRRDTDGKREDAGNDGDVSSVASDQSTVLPANWLERGLLDSSSSEMDNSITSQTSKSTTTLTTTQPTKLGVDPYNNPINTTIRNNRSGKIGRCHERDTINSASAWSSTSASEDSDDGSRSFVSSDTIQSSMDRNSSIGRLASSDNLTREPQSLPLSAVPSQSPSPESSVRNNNSPTVSSRTTAPILPFTCAPATALLGIGGATATLSPASGTSSALPNLVNLHAAAITAGGQAIAAGWKRLRGASGEDEGQTGGGRGGIGGNQPLRLLSVGVGGGRGPASSHSSSRINKRAKREERLMKNREAANRSRVKRKEVLSELENRTNTLTQNLAESRAENSTLHQEMASLREQNSFLRGMLSATGNMVDLPPILPTSANPRYTNSAANCIGGGGGNGRDSSGAAVAGVSAIIGAIGTGLTVVSCVALSTAVFETGSDGRHGMPPASSVMRNGNGFGKAGGRRTLLSINDQQYLDQFGQQSVVSSGLRYFPQLGVLQWAGVAVAVALVFWLFFFAARAAYDMAVRCRGGYCGKSLIGVRRRIALLSPFFRSSRSKSAYDDNRKLL